MSFSALILAGGRSSRMGCDKAWLEIEGRPLIERQLALVRAAGAVEVFISGRAAPDFAALGCRVLEDTFREAGPLAGIERGLAATTSPRLLVLAVDLPRMELGFLQRLTAACTDHCGVVSERRGGLEPLVAVYPKSAHARAVQQLEAGRNAVREFAEICEAAGELRRLPVAAAVESLFLNWNTPGDLPGGNAAPAFLPSDP